MPKPEGHVKTQRILIANYGNVLVPELIKILDDKQYCLYVLFNDMNEIGFIQKALGKKRLIPILTGNSDKVKGQKEAIQDEIIKTLPDLDAVINIDNSVSISKFYDKRKRFKTTEMKVHKVTASEIKNFLDSLSEPCLLNLTPETTIGLKHMFDAEGLEVPIRTHISASFQNSFRKLFQTKTKDEEPRASSSETTVVSLSPPHSGRSTPRLTSKPGHAAPPSETVNDLLDRLEKPKKQRGLSILRKKKEPLVASKSEPQLVPASTNSASLENELRHKENASFKKSLNKLHAKFLQRQVKELKKLDTGKVKDQNSAEKVIEEEMRVEKGRLESKCNDLNSTTLARSTALTPETANKIIVSREARVNKEVYRNANRKKITEFEKIEENYQEKLSQLKIKQTAQHVKHQQETIQRIRTKYQERFSKKILHRSHTTLN